MESRADRNRVDFRILPFFSIRVGSSGRSRLPSLLALWVQRLASPSVLQMDLLRPIEAVWKPEGLSSVSEGQGVGVALAVEAGFRRLRPDVGINFVEAKPD